MSPLFAAEAMWKAFGRHPVLRNASVWAYPGAVTVLLGRNGAGKSTLMRCALGFIRPVSGMVRFGETRYTRPSLARLARDGLFFLPDRRLLSRRFTLRQHLAALARRFVRATPDAALDTYDTRSLQDRPWHEMSGGEERRAELTVAAARHPICLVADEPFRGIAPIDAEYLAARLRGLAAAGTAVLITGHEIESLLPVADHIIWMVGGTTHHLGTPAEALAHRAFRMDYLEFIPDVGSAG